MPLKSETARVGRGLVWVLCCAIFLAASAGFQRIAGAVSRPSALITQAVSDANLVTLTGNIRPEATSANDRGAGRRRLAMEHMLLQLRRSPEQEQALEKYLDQLEDPKSPNYHRWLTRAGIRRAVRSGGDQDLATITAWLESHGFSVKRVYPSGIVIDFSGTAGQVREAFHTEIHNLEVNGAAHIANMSDPQIPAALAPAVVGVVSLNDFRPHAMNKPRPAYTFSGCGDVTGGDCYADGAGRPRHYLQFQAAVCGGLFRPGTDDRSRRRLQTCIKIPLRTGVLFAPPSDLRAHIPTDQLHAGASAGNGAEQLQRSESTPTTPRRRSTWNGRALPRPAPRSRWLRARIPPPRSAALSRWRTCSTPRERRRRS